MAINPLFKPAVFRGAPLSNEMRLQGIIGAIAGFILLVQADAFILYTEFSTFSEIFSQTAALLADADTVIEAHLPYHEFKLIKAISSSPVLYKDIIEEMEKHFNDRTKEAKNSTIWTLLLVNTFSSLQETDGNLIEGLLNEALLENNPLAMFGCFEPFSFAENGNPVWSFESVFEEKMRSIILGELNRISYMMADGKMSQEGWIDFLVFIHQYSLCVDHAKNTFMNLNYIIQAFVDYPETTFDIVKRKFQYDNSYFSIDALKDFVVQELSKAGPEADLNIHRRLNSSSSKHYGELKSWAKNRCPLPIEDPLPFFEAIEKPDTRDKLRLFMAIYSFDIHKFLRKSLNENNWWVLIHEALASINNVELRIPGVDLQEIELKLISNVMGLIFDDSDYMNAYYVLWTTANFGLKHTASLILSGSTLDTYIEKIVATRWTHEWHEMCKFIMSAIDCGDSKTALLFFKKVYDRMDQSELEETFFKAVKQDQVDFLKEAIPLIKERSSWPTLLTHLITQAGTSASLSAFVFLSALSNQKLVSDFLCSNRCTEFVVKVIEAGYQEGRVCALMRRIRQSYQQLAMGKMLIEAAANGFVNFIDEFGLVNSASVPQEDRSRALLAALSNKQATTAKYLISNANGLILPSGDIDGIFATALKEYDMVMSKLMIKYILSSEAAIRSLVYHERYQLLEYIEKDCNRPFSYEQIILLITQVLEKAGFKKRADPIKKCQKYFLIVDQDSLDEALTSASKNLELDKTLFLINETDLSFSESCRRSLSPMAVTDAVEN